MPEVFKNFGLSVVAVGGAPSPATSGTTLTLTTGDGALEFPATSGAEYFNVIVSPTRTPDYTVAEECLATRSGDVLTLVRAQGGTTARAIVDGDLVWASPTVVTYQNFLQKSGGTLTGALEIAATGNALVVNTDAFVVDATNKRIGVGGITAPAQAVDILGSFISLARLSSDASGPGFVTYKGRNTLADPRRTQSADVIGNMFCYGYTAVDDSTTAVKSTGAAKGQARFVAAESFTAGGQGTYWHLFTTPIASATALERIRIASTGNVSIGTVADGTSRLTLAAGSATANTAPLQFTSGALETVARAGVVEFLTDAYYAVVTTGAVRKTFAFLESPTFVTPNIGVASGTSLALSGAASVVGNASVYGDLNTNAIYSKGPRPWVDVRNATFDPLVSGSFGTTTGTIANGTNTLTVASTASFSVNHGVAFILDDGTTLFSSKITAINALVLTLLNNATQAATAKTIYHDDTAGIQAAIDHGVTQGTGFRIFAPTGTYRMRQVLLPTRTHLCGSGFGTIFYSLPGNTADAMFKNSAVTSYDIVLENFTVDGQKSASPAPTCGGVFYDSGSQVAPTNAGRMVDVYIHDVEGYGVRLRGYAGGRFRGLTATLCDGHSLSLEANDVGSTSPDNWFFECLLTNSGLHNLYSVSPFCHFIGSSFYWSGQVDATTSGDCVFLGTGANNTQMSGCDIEDAFRHGVHISGANDCLIDFIGMEVEQDVVRITSGDRNIIRGKFSNDVRRTADSIVNVIGGSNNEVDMSYNPASMATASPVIGASVGTNSNIVHCRHGGGTQAVAYAATVTPDPYAYTIMLIGTLTGNITVANPAFQHVGQKLQIQFTQDGTGDRIVTWGTAYATLENWQPLSTPGEVSLLTIVYDGTTWRQEDRRPWNVILKPTDETRTSTTTLTDDTHLIFPMLASTKYAFRMQVLFDTAATPDFKYRHVGPAIGAGKVRIQRRHVIPGATAFVVAVDVAYSAADVTVVGTGTNGGYVEFVGVVHNGTTAGNFSFRWAQNTSDAGSTTVLAGSQLEWRQL